jgi:hypothetical protein
MAMPEAVWSEARCGGPIAAGFADPLPRPVAAKSAGLRAPARQRRALSPRDQRVLRLITTQFAVPHADLCRLRRGTRATAFARQAAMYLFHVACGASLSEVGRIFRRDRTTVAHACMMIEDRRDDPAFDRRIARLESAIAAIAAQDPGACA